MLIRWSRQSVKINRGDSVLREKPCQQSVEVVQLPLGPPADDARRFGDGELLAGSSHAEVAMEADEGNQRDHQPEARRIIRVRADPDSVRPHRRQDCCCQDCELRLPADAREALQHPHEGQLVLNLREDAVQENQACTKKRERERGQGRVVDWLEDAQRQAVAGGEVAPRQRQRDAQQGEGERPVVVMPILVG